jgi:small-conductance mechanosensitive channel
MAGPPVRITPATQTELRIGWLTLIFGALAAVATTLLHQPRWAGGLLVGSVLAWFNYRWLRQGMNALAAASQAQAGLSRPRVPIGAYFRVLFRYALIAATVYVIFRLLKFPLASMVAGLCALGPAAIAASVYEIARPATLRK